MPKHASETLRHRASVFNIAGATQAALTTQNWLRKGHTSEGIHDALFPASVGDGVWPPSYEHQRTGFPAGQPM